MSARNAKSKAKPSTGQVVVQPDAAEPVETAFAEVVGLIEQARQRAYQAVDSELVGLYWRIGQYISAKLAAAVWGEGVVDRLAQHLARTMPGQRGFTRRNLFRMRQFYEAYSAADTTAVDAQPDHPDPVQASRRARVLSAHGRAAALGQARAGAPVPPGRLRARGAEPGKSVTSADTNARRRRRERLQGHLFGRVPEPALAGCRPPLKWS